MGTPAPDAVKRPVERFDRDRKDFLSGDYKEEQLPKAKTPHEQESFQRQIAATDKAIVELVYELYGLTEEEVRVAEDERREDAGRHDARVGPQGSC
jgi:hypothetical protein